MSLIFNIVYEKPWENSPHSISYFTALCNLQRAFTNISSLDTPADKGKVGFIVGMENKGIHRSLQCSERSVNMKAAENRA